MNIDNRSVKEKLTKENETDFNAKELQMLEDFKKDYDIWDSYPIVLKPNEVMEITRLSRDVVYALLKKPVESGGIPHLSYGHCKKKRYLVYKASLKEWLEKMNGECCELAV